MGQGWRRIIFKAHQLTRQPGFNATDFDDIVQELALRVWRKVHTYDARRAQYSTFIDRVVESEAKSLVRERTAAKRDFRREGRSLDTVVGDGDGHESTGAECLADNAHDYRLGRCSKDPGLEELTRAAHRLAASAENEVERIVFAGILQGRPITLIASDAGISRAGVYRTLERVCHRHRDCGLDNFLDD